MPLEHTLSAHEEKLLGLFERAYEAFHSVHHRGKDPLGWVYRFQSKEDREVAAFLASLLAYGNVTAILKNLNHLHKVLGDKPAERIRDSDPWDLTTFVHRFTKGIDIEVVLYRLRVVLQSAGSLEKFFVGPGPRGSSMKTALGSFVDRFEAIPLPTPLKDQAKARERNLKYLLSHPTRGSACKRLNLFLRWVVRREDGIDLGLWTEVSPADLVLPVDTHLLQTLQKLRWTRSKTANWDVAEKATARLKRLCPEDPLRYDFALCHLSMEGGNLLKP